MATTKMNFNEWVMTIKESNAIEGIFESDVLKSYHENCEPNEKIDCIEQLRMYFKKECFSQGISITLESRCLPDSKYSRLTTFPYYLFY